MALSRRIANDTETDGSKMIHLTYDPIDVAQAMAVVRSSRAGAVVLFVGSTREFTGARQTKSLLYECYEEMTRYQLSQLESQARARWDLVDICIVHRLGNVGIGEDSVAIAVSAAHREPAFLAGQWLIDSIKQGVPIWKRERWADGSEEWVHPGVESSLEEHAGRQPDPSQEDSIPIARVSHSRGDLLDRFGRLHSNLRISVTDRCNIRCLYCMPDERVQFKPRREVLTFEEIERFVKVMVTLGIERLRITGGEPLVRDELPVLVRKLNGIAGIRDIAMTTNGMLLAECAEQLKEAGLQRVNISLDCLSEATFQQITRRSGLDRVLRGIRAAQEVGFDQIRLNAVALRGISTDQIIPLADFARRENLQLRFIEFMPLDGEGRWKSDEVISGAEVRQELEQNFGPLVAVRRPDDTQPAVDYRYADGMGTIGFIDSVTQPFCPKCNRLRITAEGRVRNCLFSDVEWDVRALLRGGGSDDEIADLVRACVAAKKTGHGIDTPEFIHPGRPMNELGG
jgi:cyclic pyranopterin phosphate synthase